MKKGISLVSLVITIVVIIILASIVIFSSLGTVEQAELAKNEAELNDVCTFVNEIVARYEAGVLTLDLSDSTLAGEDDLKEFLVEPNETGVEFTSDDVDDIVSKNAARTSNPKYGYHLVRGRSIENDAIPGLENLQAREGNYTLPRQVVNDYIINFGYGTVIAKVSDTQNRVRGSIK